MTWKWIDEAALYALHDEQISEFGGSSGVRDQGLLVSALARPKNQAAYGEVSVFDLAAAYAYGIVRNHPFIDGNKRAGFLAAAIFLEINGWQFQAAEVDVVNTIVALADGSLSEKKLAAWLKKNAVKE